jgi:hypothetical protein
MNSNELSGTLQVVNYAPSQATAGTDDNWPVWQAPLKCVITSVNFVPSAAITADGTNYSVYTLTKYTAGASGATVATRSWIATNSVAKTPEAMTLSGTAANLLLAADDTLEIVKTHGGTGLAIPDGLIVIRYQLTGS